MYGEIAEQSAIDKLASKLPATAYPDGETAVHDSVIRAAVEEAREWKQNADMAMRLADYLSDRIGDITDDMSRMPLKEMLVAFVIGVVAASVLVTWF